MNDSMEYWWNCTRREICPIFTLSAPNPIQMALGSNQGLCDDKLATNCLSHGTSWLLFNCPARPSDRPWL